MLHPPSPCYTLSCQVATLSGGDCFGEIALLVPGARRTASIVAMSFCEAHQLFREDFEVRHRCRPREGGT